MRQTFALGGVDDDTHAAAEQTRAARRRFEEQKAADAAPQPFVTQVPVEVAKPATPEPRPVMNTQPTTPWPATNPSKPTIDWDAAANAPVTSAPAAAAWTGTAGASAGTAGLAAGAADSAAGAATGIFGGAHASSLTSNGESRLGDYALGGDPATGLEGPGVTNPDVTPEMIAEARARIDAARAAAAARAAGLDPAAAAPFPEPVEGDASTSSATEGASTLRGSHSAISSDEPSSATEGASTGSASEEPAPRFMSRREARLAEAAAHPVAAEQPATVPTIAWDTVEPLIDTSLLTPAVAEAAAHEPVIAAEPEDDPWASGSERRVEPAATPWTNPTPTSRPISGSRPALPLPPSRSATASAWLLALTPLILVVGSYLVLDLLAAYWQAALAAVCVIVWLFGLLFAQQDRARLITLGHMRPPRATWALLTAPVYLTLRAVAARKMGARANGPLIGWAVCFVLVMALIATVFSAPELLPTYLVDTLLPLREALGVPTS